jgi:hypothetical protein
LASLNLWLVDCLFPEPGRRQSDSSDFRQLSGSKLSRPSQMPAQKFECPYAMNRVRPIEKLDFRVFA